MNTYWAIQHIPSGELMPHGKGPNGRGGTHAEPGKGLPRLFRKQQHAKVALRHWLAGKIKVTYSAYGDDCGELRTLTPIPSRRPEDMKVVEVTLTVTDPR